MKFWILQDDFSQNWHFKPDCFYECSPEHDNHQKELLDTYAVKEVGEEPAKYGYVKIEGESEEPNDGSSISIVCDTKEDLEWVYTRMCVTLLDHPSVLDLRGLNVRII